MWWVNEKCLALCPSSLSAYSPKGTPALSYAHHLHRVGVHEKRAVSIRWTKTLDLAVDTATSCAYHDTHACSTSLATKNNILFHVCINLPLVRSPLGAYRLTLAPRKQPESCSKVADTPETSPGGPADGTRGDFSGGKRLGAKARGNCF